MLLPACNGPGPLGPSPPEDSQVLCGFRREQPSTMGGYVGDRDPLLLLCILPALAFVLRGSEQASPLKPPLGTSGSLRTARVTKDMLQSVTCGSRVSVVGQGAHGGGGCFKIG